MVIAVSQRSTHSCIELCMYNARWGTQVDLARLPYDQRTRGQLHGNSRDEELGREHCHFMAQHMNRAARMQVQRLKGSQPRELRTVVVNLFASSIGCLRCIPIADEHLRGLLQGCPMHRHARFSTMLPNCALRRQSSMEPGLLLCPTSHVRSCDEAQRFLFVLLSRAAIAC
jgi:hypothetical protein